MRYMPTKKEWALKDICMYKWELPSKPGYEVRRAG